MLRYVVNHYCGADKNVFVLYRQIDRLMELLESGGADRKLLVQAIRSCGATGEQKLIDIVAHHTSARIRGCAAYGLGLPEKRQKNEDIKLKVLVISDFAVTFTAAPRIFFPSTKRNATG